MVVNEIKTKVMCLGFQDPPKLLFNGINIKIVESYKYLGNILSLNNSPVGNIFPNNLEHLTTQGRRALFSMRSKLKNACPTPPRISLHLFNATVKPIVCYGSDIWGIYAPYQDTVDTFHRKFLKQTLSVKTSTHNAITYGEVGQFPISIDLLSSAFIYYHRLLHMPDKKLVKYVFNEMLRLHNVGFTSWVTAVTECAVKCNIDFNTNIGNFKLYVKRSLQSLFLQSWSSDLLSPDRFPILRLYRTFKHDFSFETYLSCVKIDKHLKALARFRSNSHHLVVETGRWAGLPISQRICQACNALDDEIHLVCHCKLYSVPRSVLLRNLSDMLGPKFENFKTLLFRNLMSTKIPEVIAVFASFVFNSFKIKDKFIEG